MENVTRVLARIETLRAQMGVPVSPGVAGGHFQQLLDARVQSDPESTPSPQPALQRTVTLGSMMTPGGIIPVSVSNPGSWSTILDAAGLDSFLEARGTRHRNGHLRAEDLREVAGGWEGPVRLLEPAAASWEAMRNEAALEGVELLAIDSYRSWETQARAHDAYRAGEKPAYVAPPGRSEHGVGLAVDVTNGHLVGAGDPEWEWLNANASRFGWYPISNESWHWEFRGV